MLLGNPNQAIHPVIPITQSPRRMRWPLVAEPVVIWFPNSIVGSRQVSFKVTQQVWRFHLVGWLPPEHHKTLIQFNNWYRKNLNFLVRLEVCVQNEAHHEK